MAKDSKFGTFGGVFTPSLLTILGVIMYMRLPWVVGQAGLWSALGIILVAHVISVCTGLSISSIATDKTVGAGGPYYIVSRSLGLSIGGTLGLALFIGLAASVSLYIIGFSESFLSTLGHEVTKTEVRIVGSVTLIALTVVTLISTSFAIKTQYVILALIVLSLGSIFAGPTASGSAGPHLMPSEGSESPAALFAIFFPAVTGFTAGVNMSGDLRDPRKAIPKGTMAAIVTGMVVYVGLAVFLALRVPAEVLLDDKRIVLKDVAFNRELVVAGIWGATLSSAIGSIMGAPRILQALSVDRITPRVFAKGHGKTNEPRNALVLAFLIAEGGILIAELNEIARIVSMVFLTTYGFLNMSSAIESWASPDFRPAFRIPRMVSVLGAVTSVVVMIQLDLLAMLGATALMAGLFVYLKGKQLTLESGDTWEGIWSSLVRSGLYRLGQESEQRRNWRPNIVAFRTPDDAQEAAEMGVRGDELSRFGETLVGGNGILTVFELTGARKKGVKAPGPMAPRVGVFARRLESENPYEAITLLARYHGFAGLSPNTVLMQYRALSSKKERLTTLLQQLSDLDKNLLLYTAGARSGRGLKRIDIWWRPEAGNLSLSVALARFLTSSEQYHEAAVRFLMISDDAASNEHLRTMVRRMLSDARLEASVRVVGALGSDESFSERLAKESAESDLTLLGLPNDLEAAGDDVLGYVERARKSLGQVLFIWAASSFSEDLGLGARAAISFLPPAPGDGEAKLPEISVPSAPALARAVSDLVDHHQRFAKQFHERAVERVYGEHVRLIRDAARAVERQFEQLERGFPGANPRQQQKLINRVQSTLLIDSRKLLSDFRETLDGHVNAMQGQVEAFLQDEALLHGSGGAELVVVRSADDFKPQKGDSPYLRRFKRRRRFAALFRRADVSYRVPIQGLLRYYFEQTALDVVQAGVLQVVTDTHRAIVELGRLLSSGGTAFSLDVDDDPKETVEAVQTRKKQLIDRLHELGRVYKERAARQQWKLLVASRQLCQAFSNDVSRLDVRPLVEKERKTRGVIEAFAGEMGELCKAWRDNQRRLVERAELGLTIAGFHFRLSSIAHKERTAILLQIKNGPMSTCSALKRSVEALAAKLDEGNVPADALKVRLDLGTRFEPKQAVESLLQETAETVGELPEVVTTLSDASIRLLEDGNADSLEVVEIPVRRLFQFLVETKFVGGVQQGLKSIPRHEQRLVSVAQDVERLIAFQVSEAEVSDDESSDELRQYLRNVVDSGLTRLTSELAELATAMAQINVVFEEQLEALAESGNAYELTATSLDLEQHIRRAQGRRAVRGARSLMRGGAAELKAFMVKMMYRHSAGRLWAQRQRDDAGDGLLVDRVLSFVERHTPRSEVVEALPFYYRQLFFGQATVNENFWVGRSEELDRVKKAVSIFRQGTSGAIMVVGERGAGKTALCQRISARLLERFTVYRVHPPLGGSIDLGAFRASLAKSTGLRGELPELFRALPENSALVLDDLELWWERSAEGDRVLLKLMEMIQRYGRRILFVLSLSRPAFHFIDRLCGLSDQALAVVETGPLSAEELKSIMTLRHGSTGLCYQLDGTAEADLGEISKARLFFKYFEYSRGLVGPALHAWMARVDKVTDQTISISAPRIRDWDVFEQLKVEWVALLLELFLHKQLSAARLRRLTGQAAPDLERNVATLVRMRVVNEPRIRVYEINPAISHVLSDRFKEKGLLA